MSVVPSDEVGTRYIKLSNGETIPLIKSTSFSSKMKARHVIAAAKKYLSMCELARLLERDHKVVCIRTIENCTTVEEELLAKTHLVIVVEKEEGVKAECVAPVDESGQYMQYATQRQRMSSSTFYRGVADHNGFALVSFSYIIESTQTTVTFNVYYVDFYSLEVRKHASSVDVPTRNKFKFNILIHCGVLCILWPFHKCFSVLDFSAESLEFIQYPIEEDLEDFYVAEISECYLTLTTNNLDFDDDVFFNMLGSKRDTVYYSLASGVRHSSKNALQTMSTLMQIENPVDVVFINMPDKPMWMVTECCPEEMTLCSISFFSEVEAQPDDAISCVKKRIKLEDLFSSHNELFEPPNQHQINFEICNIHWHIFLWISKQHILSVDLHELEPAGVLQLQVRDYDDYKNELNDFTIKMSLSRKDVNVFVKDKKSIIHFETFFLPDPLSLKELAKYAVVKRYPKATMATALTDSPLKTDLLAAY